MEWEKTDQTGMSEKSGLFLLIALMAMGYLIGGFVAYFTWEAMTGVPFSTESMQDASRALEVRIAQTVLSVFIFLVPSYVAVRAVSRTPAAYFRLSRHSTWRAYAFGTVVMILMIFVASMLAQFTEWIPLSAQMELYFKDMEEQYLQQIEVMSQMNNWTDFVIVLITMALVPAVVEEFFFRGTFQNMMHRATGQFWVSIIITALLFSAIHFSFYGFLARTALGIVLGWLYGMSRNLWVPIVAHFINNAIAVGEVYYLRSVGRSIDDGLTEQVPWWGGCIALGALLFFIRRFHQQLSDGTR
ncbi:MAG: lysostaphin resistance A-like protein [Bacteroidota bacterium]